MRKMMVAGNWKMNKTAGEGVVLVQKLQENARKCGKKVDIVVAPPFTGIHSIATVIELDKCSMQLAAQNMYYKEDGAYTGEIAPRMLTAERCRYVILGHSERREYFGESDKNVNKKAKVVFEHDMIPILCCGETLETREANDQVPWITGQVKAAIVDLTEGEMKRAVIAYEPIWAIGTGRTATPKMAQEICELIRTIVATEYNQVIADCVRVLYGGSVNAANAEQIFSQKDIDGALVGGAALDADSFGAIIKAASDLS